MTILSLLNLRSVVLPVAALFLAGCASVPPYNLSANRRETPSGPPPTGNGLMMRTGLPWGNSPAGACARAPSGRPDAAAAAPARAIIRRRVVKVMACLVWMPPGNE